MLKVWDNTVAPLFQLLISTLHYAVSSNYRTGVLTDIQVECSFLKIGLRKFSFPQKDDLPSL